MTRLVRILLFPNVKFYGIDRGVKREAPRLCEQENKPQAKGNDVDDFQMSSSQSIDFRFRIHMFFFARTCVCGRALK